MNDEKKKKSVKSQIDNAIIEQNKVQKPKKIQPDVVIESGPFAGMTYGGDDMED